MLNWEVALSWTDLNGEVVDRIWHEGFVDASEAYEEVTSLAHWLHAAAGQLLPGVRFGVPPSSCDLRYSVTREKGNCQITMH